MLGWWDYQNDSLVDSHQIAIWDAAGTQLIAGTVAAGTTDPLLSNFRFTSSLTGTTTLARGTYEIGGLGLGHDRVAREISPGHNGTVSIAPTADDLIVRMDGAGIRRAVVLSIAYQWATPDGRSRMSTWGVKAENDWTRANDSLENAHVRAIGQVHIGVSE